VRCRFSIELLSKEVDAFVPVAVSSNRVQWILQDGGTKSATRRLRRLADVATPSIWLAATDAADAAEERGAMTINAVRKTSAID
jgi:hypothetical protein